MIVVFLLKSGFEPQTNSSRIESAKTVVLILSGTARFSNVRLDVKKPPSGGFFVPSQSQLNGAAREES